MPVVGGIAAGSIAGATGIIVGFDYNGTFSAGGIVASALVLAFGAVFTYRANAAKTWRETAEAREERIKELSNTLERERTERAAEREEDRMVRHDLKGEVARLRLATDLTVLIKQMADDRKLAAERFEAALDKLAEHDVSAQKRHEELVTMSKAQTDVLGKMAEKLAA
jgi:glutamate-1-semialdehyde aminotransferase